jgi:hypothetical protein
MIRVRIMRAKNALISGEASWPSSTPPAVAFVSRSFIIIFSLAVGMSISTNAETVKVMDKASTDGSFTIAQTNGMEQRQDRRGDRQGCRQQEGAVGAAKRICKQEGRQTRGG